MVGTVAANVRLAGNTVPDGGNGAKVDLAHDAGAGDYAIDVSPHIRRKTQSGARYAVGDHHTVVVFSRTSPIRALWVS